MVKMKKIGVVTHYYDKIKVGIVKLEKDLNVGSIVKFIGNTTDFDQEVDDMQFDHKEITGAKKGQEVGIKVDEKVRKGDKMYWCG